MKGIFLHFNLGYSYYSHAPVRELIFDRLAATVVTGARGGGHLAGRRAVGGDHLRAAPALAA